ncbi:MAG TPA: DNA polymerase [Streptomyces sp.]|nr:DNA polymerase [Streptomyces sp.]
MGSVPHIIKPAAGGRRPAAACIVQVQYDRAAAGFTSSTRRLTWRAGSLSFVTYRAGRAGRRRVAHFTDAETFWRTLVSYVGKRPEVWLISWGLRELAAAVGVWDRLEDGTLRMTGTDPAADPAGGGGGGGEWSGYCVLQSPPTIIYLRLGAAGPKLRWVDPANYGVDSLAGMIAERYPDWRPGAAEGEDADGRAATSPVLCNAVESWWHGWLDMVAGLDLGSVQSTAASQAMHAYRHRYMSDTIHIHADPAATALERAALYSGRCECRYLGHVFQSDIEEMNWQHQRPGEPTLLADGPVYHLDVNSLYPAVARGAAVPARLKRWTDRATVEELQAAAAAGPVFARVLIETQEPTVPVRLAKPDATLPRRVNGEVPAEGGPVEAGVIWPVGRFWTTLAGPELKLAARHGRILAVSEMAEYEGKRLFGLWVDDLYQTVQACKAAGNAATAAAAKRVLNALFGKFAQRDRSWQPWPSELASEPYAQWWGRDVITSDVIQWRSFGWNVERMVDVGESYDAFPAVTAWINSLARVWLWRLISIAGPPNVLYYDTDSLWVTPAGGRRLAEAGAVDRAALGKLKVVGQHRHVRFYGIKHYRADGRTVHAGIPATARPAGEGRAIIEQGVPTETYLWQHRSPQPELAVRVVRTVHAYRHGRVVEGGRVEPHRVVDVPDSR